mgnify:CR=1 FL=1
MVPLSVERLEAILARARGLRVVVVGDLMLDVYLTGSVGRISPEAPVPVVHVQEERVALGGAANVAANVVALGADCDLVGVVGPDAAGAEVVRALTAQGSGAIRPFLHERADRPTTTKTRVIARSQQVVRFDREDAGDLPEAAAQEIAAQVRAAVAGADALVLEDYNKGVLVPGVIGTALEAARAAGIPTVVDPKFRHFFHYQGATVFKPNVLELGTALAGTVHHQDDGWLAAARERLQCEHLLVTLGEEGMVLQSREGPALRIPTLAREVYDVSGAGDTVTAALAVALAAGATIAEAAILANYAAGVEVAKQGVATVSPQELRAAVAYRLGGPAVPPLQSQGDPAWNRSR